MKIAWHDVYRRKTFRTHGVAASRRTLCGLRITDQWQRAEQSALRSISCQRCLAALPDSNQGGEER